MSPDIIAVIANDDFSLTLEYETGERRIFDVRPYMELGIFQELKNPAYFQRVGVSLGTIAWPHGQDFCPDTLFEKSVSCTPATANK
jgi:hypothetical protein